MSGRLLSVLLALAATGCTAAPEAVPEDAGTAREPRRTWSGGGGDASHEHERPPPSVTPATNQSPEEPEAYRANPWPDPAHGRGPGAGPASGAVVRFVTPERRDVRPASTSLQGRPRLGLVVVRDGQLVHAPAVLLDLEARLDGAVAAVVALRPRRASSAAPPASVGLDDLAEVAREGGLDLVLVDVRLSGDAREAWLVAAATRDLVGAFVGGTTRAAPPELELLARIERAWLALP